MFKESFPYIVGYLIAIVMGHYATRSIVELMWDYINLKNPGNKKLVRYQGQQEIVGLVERSLYYGALLANQAIFIGVWLTLKTISRSPRWEQDTKGVPGRAIFQPFLAGTGSSLLFAFGGYAVTFLLTRFYTPNSLLLPWLELSIPPGVLAIMFGLIATWVGCIYFGKKALNALVSELKEEQALRSASTTETQVTA